MTKKSKKANEEILARLDKIEQYLQDRFNWLNIPQEKPVFQAKNKKAAPIPPV